jgi:ABC-type transporter Mla subunit MlaD
MQETESDGEEDQRGFPMNEVVSELPKIESELKNAIGVLNKALEDFEELEDASTTLKQLSQESREVAKAMGETARKVEEATAYLSQEGVAEFSRRLDELKSNLDARDAELQRIVGATGESVLQATEGIVLRESERLHTKIARVQMLVIGVVIPVIGLLGYLVFLK